MNLHSLGKITLQLEVLRIWLVADKFDGKSVVERLLHGIAKRWQAVVVVAVARQQHQHAVRRISPVHQNVPLYS